MAIDDKILQLIPHRPPMLLIHELIDVNDKASMAKVVIDDSVPFFRAGQGVPAWIGVEYMGQTAALIAGHQVQQGSTTPHLGFLLGTRKYRSEISHFPDNSILSISCQEQALVGESLATFACDIRFHADYSDDEKLLATASLTVFRKPVESI